MLIPTNISLIILLDCEGKTNSVKLLSAPYNLILYIYSEKDILTKELVKIDGLGDPNQLKIITSNK